MAKLSGTKIRNAKPKAKPFKLYDAEGLFLIVTPNGGRWWRQRYRWQTREQLLSLGTYPEVDLATARERRDAARKLVANGINPSAARQEEKAALRDSEEQSYKAVSEKWLEITAASRRWTADHTDRVKTRQEKHFYPWLGRKPVSSVTEDDVRACLLRITDRGILDTAYRARAEAYSIFRWAKSRKLVKVNPVTDLREDPDIIPKHKAENHAAIKDPARFGTLLRAIDNYPGGYVVRCALQLQALVFVRPGELRLAEWSEFDLDGAEWRIPGPRMKMREHHIVPLSKQALAVLQALNPVTGPEGHVFPQMRNASRPISNNTLNAALRTLGFAKSEATAHGFRSTASTMLNEFGIWHPDAIERQLAHGERNKVRSAYNSAQHLPERRRMMQAWADYLDTLRAGAIKVAA